MNRPSILQLSSAVKRLGTERAFEVLAKAKALEKKGQDIINLGTGLTIQLWKEILDIDLPEEFPIYSYHEAMDRFGSDKPDTRFDMELQEFSEFVKASNFNAKVFIID